MQTDYRQRQLLQRKMDYDLPIGFMAVWKERKEIFTCYSLSSGKQKMRPSQEWQKWEKAEMRCSTEEIVLEKGWDLEWF